MITKTELDLELQDYLASTSNIKVDSAKRVRALNTAINQLLDYAWDFAVKKIDFSYLAATNEYELDGDLGITDFHSHHYLDNKKPQDPRQFNSEAEGIAYVTKNGVKCLLCNLGNADQTFDFEYYSDKLVNDSSGAGIDGFTADGIGEYFIGPKNMMPCLVQLAYYELLRKAKNIDKSERQEAYTDAQNKLASACDKYGHIIVKPSRRIRISK